MLLLVDIQCELGGAISAEAVTPNYSALIRCVVGVSGEGWGQGWLLLWAGTRTRLIDHLFCRSSDFSSVTFSGPSRRQHRRNEGGQ